MWYFTEEKTENKDFDTAEPKSKQERHINHVSNEIVTYEDNIIYETSTLDSKEFYNSTGSQNDEMEVELTDIYSQRSSIVGSAMNSSSTSRSDRGSDKKMSTSILNRYTICKNPFCRGFTTFMVLCVLALAGYIMAVYFSQKDPCVSIALDKLAGNFSYGYNTASAFFETRKGEMPFEENIKFSEEFLSRFGDVEAHIRRPIRGGDDSGSIFDNIDWRPSFNVSMTFAMDLEISMAYNITNINWFAIAIDLSVLRVYYPQYEDYEYELGSSKDEEKKLLKSKETINGIMPLKFHLNNEIIETVFKENHVGNSFHVGNITFDVVGSAVGSLRLLELVEVGEVVDIFCSITYFPGHGNYTQVCLPEIDNKYCS